MIYLIFLRVLARYGARWRRELVRSFVLRSTVRYRCLFTTTHIYSTVGQYNVEPPLRHHLTPGPRADSAQAIRILTPFSGSLSFSLHQHVQSLRPRVASPHMARYTRSDLRCVRLSSPLPFAEPPAAHVSTPRSDHFWDLATNDLGPIRRSRERINLVGLSHIHTTALFHFGESLRILSNVYPNTLDYIQAAQRALEKFREVRHLDLSSLDPPVRECRKKLRKVRNRPCGSHRSMVNR